MTKFVSLEEAVATIPDGITLAFGGMTLYRRPAAFARALARRRPRDLTLLCFTAGYESDLLIGAGCAAAIRTCYAGLETFGFAPMFTDAVQKGELTIIEETEASLVMGLRARMAGVGFMPSRAWIGTDLPRLRPDVRTITCPYTGDQLTAFPAIGCDVAVLHASQADRAGNIKIDANIGIDNELVYVAQTVIVTVERIVEQVQPAAGAVIIPAPGATLIAEVPHGAAPTSCYPEYPLSGVELLRYIDACNSGQFLDYLR